MAAATVTTTFLLLDDCIGERISRAERYKQIVVNKGALLKGPKSLGRFSVSRGNPRSNVRYCGATVRIPGGKESSKVAPLSDLEFRFLKGVAGDSARYEVYTSGRLQLKVGENVFVKLAHVREPVAAVLRWRGVVHRGINIPGFRYYDTELKFGAEIVVGQTRKN